MNFIKLTHFSTGNVTYIKSESITGVSQGFDRSLLFVDGQQPAHYKESAEYIMDLIHGGGCNLGPIPTELVNSEPVNGDIVYTVTADYDMEHGNEFEHKVFRNRLDAIDFFKGLVSDFTQIVKYQLCQDDTDLENLEEAIPSVYLVDADHENFARITVEELTIA